MYSAPVVSIRHQYVSVENNLPATFAVLPAAVYIAQTPASSVDCFWLYD
jgi:hypothetical protein